MLPVLIVLALGTASAKKPAPPPPPPITCEAVVSLGSAWVSSQGNTSYTTVNLNIINKAAAILAVPWTLTLKNAAYGNIRQVHILPLSLHGVMLERPHSVGPCGVCPRIESPVLKVTGHALRYDGCNTANNPL